MFRGISFFSVDTVVTLAPVLYILERLVLSLLTFIYFGSSVLVLLSDRIADGIYLDLLIVFTVSSVSVPLEALDLSNDIHLFDSLPIYLSFLL